MGTPLQLIVGLGNPGPEHLTTRHNAGFWLVDLLARNHSGKFRSENRFHGEIAEINVDGHRIRLLKPMTYMNDSGRSVAAVTTYYKVPLEHVLLAYDELDLSPGRAQLKFDGGHGGHNGMRNVVECVGKKFWRLRLGIGHPGPGRRDQVTNYVLQRPSAEDQEAILNAVVSGVEALPVFLDEGAEKAKTQLHSRDVEPRPYKKIDADRSE